MQKSLFIALFISLLGGCVSLDLSPKNIPSIVYVLADAPAPPLPVGPSHPHTLLVEATHASTYDDNEDLVFSSKPNTRGRYKYARWSERPSVKLSELLFNRFVNAQLYATVVNAGSDVTADRRLSTELLAFYHDASTNPGKVHIALRAELFDTLHHRLIARRLFEQNTPLVSYDAAGAAAAFNLANQALLTDISNWLSTAETP